MSTPFKLKYKNSAFPFKSPVKHRGPWNDAGYIAAHAKEFGEDHENHPAWEKGGKIGEAAKKFMKTITK
tara:strand:+ start:50 stop:256 length:207 start_codon:yes stop_codon:yes gene_type:complete